MKFSLYVITIYQYVKNLWIFPVSFPQKETGGVTKETRSYFPIIFKLLEGV